jgi:hypothetical protein
MNLIIIERISEKIKKPRIYNLFIFYLKGILVILLYLKIKKIEIQFLKILI